MTCKHMEALSQVPHCCNRVTHQITWPSSIASDSNLLTPRQIDTFTIKHLLLLFYNFMRHPYILFDSAVAVTN